MKLSGARILFRVDASRQIGTGHVVRDLTLADALQECGADCLFIGRSGGGDLRDVINARGHDACWLPSADGASISWEDDARATHALLQGEFQDLLVCDHYSLDHRWESALRGACARIMVVDDLADRTHDCDLLLDQNLGRSERDYRGRVPDTCSILAGATFALLRPQFQQARSNACSRRERGDLALRRILVSLGGSDPTNATGAVLRALASAQSAKGLEIDVVVGAASPWLDEVRTAALHFPGQVRVLSNVEDMAGLMAESDLAIGAGGTTSWERCCLGLPTALIVLADNQRPGARALAGAGAVWLVGEQSDIGERLPMCIESFRLDPRQLRAMSRAASQVTDGAGAERVIERLTSL